MPTCFLDLRADGAEKHEDILAKLKVLVEEQASAAITSVSSLHCSRARTNIILVRRRLQRNARVPRHHAAS